MITNVINKLLEPTKKGTYAFQIGNIRLGVYIQIPVTLVLILNSIHLYKDVITLINIVCLSIMVLSLLIGIYGAIVLREKVDSIHLKYIHQFIFLVLGYLFIFIFIIL